ncbi:MotA/TolQ/ExbB proton channel family protein [Pandoraea fibrosis]|uniref:Biopolymer transport protein ExbB n=1 Tax=Pandoraea fibrosis TaxID=1891094 RepID=A0ABX6HMC5_9BURK|nr:MotA/TolQ/ExbB proton channel family protein [Pandoraea fibrosis]QHE91195.1 MotA/TolQ/ExbB proton channel family protein [Pandoraea fibrosis]QHF12026.1 MotA/TolQ/ExbB proton channel family protein [Pandoraea fibrosis]
MFQFPYRATPRKRRPLVSTAVICALTTLVALASPGAHAASAEINPYGLQALWEGGDMIARGTLLILVIMSMGSWYIIVAKLLEQAKILRRARAAEKTFWNAASLSEGIRSLDAGSPFRYIAETALSARDHHTGALLDQVDLNTWIASAIERAMTGVSNRLQDGLSFLGTVGSTAPFVGLFGTVWGIYHALTAIGIAGQASIDKVAGPVGEALIMTAIGLAVAVPAVLGYNWLVRRNKAVMERVREFGSELHNVLLTGKTTAAAALATRAAQVARVG